MTACSSQMLHRKSVWPWMILQIRTDTLGMFPAGSHLSWVFSCPQVIVLVNQNSILIKYLPHYSELDTKRAGTANEEITVT